MEYTFDFSDHPFIPPKWKKVYKLRQLTAEECLKIEEEAFDLSSGQPKFNKILYDLLYLQRSLVSPKLSLKEIRKMPSIPFNFLLEQARRINHLTEEERRFLLSQLSSTIKFQSNTSSGRNSAKAGRK